MSAPFEVATRAARSAGEPRPPGSAMASGPSEPGYGVTAASAARSAAVSARALANARAPMSAVTSVAMTTKAHRANPISDADPR
jgi:hypothetical protein